MANLFGQLNEAMKMKKQAQEMKRKMEAIHSEYQNAGVKITVRGDGEIEKLEIVDASLIDVSKKEKLERTLLENMNKAVHQAHNMMQEQMMADLRASGDLPAGASGLMNMLRK